MFDRYTDRARHVVVVAQEQARELRHAYIGTEHLLIGLAAESEGVAAQTLLSFGITRDKVVGAVATKVGYGQIAPTGHIPFTPRSKKALELASREALQLGHNYIGTEHLLLGLIREVEGVAVWVLAMLHPDGPESVRAAVLEKLGFNSAGDEPADDHDEPVEDIFDILTALRQAANDVLGPVFAPFVAALVPLVLDPRPVMDFTTQAFKLYKEHIRGIAREEICAALSSPPKSETAEGDA